MKRLAASAKPRRLRGGDPASTLPGARQSPFSPPIEVAPPPNACPFSLSGSEATVVSSSSERVRRSRLALHLRIGGISAETWAKCKAALPGVEEQLELMSAIDTWRMISQLFRSLEIPLEDGVPPWPPDGVAPHEVGDEDAA